MKKTKIYLLVAFVVVIFYLAINFALKEQKEDPKQQRAFEDSHTFLTNFEFIPTI